MNRATATISARAARGRCFDPKRAATAPECRACSASREHRVGSQVGQDQLRLTATAVGGGARRQLLTMDHIHRIVYPRCCSESSWVRAGRVWACTRPLQSVYAAAELVCRRRVVVLVPMSRVLLLWDVLHYGTKYYSFAY